MQSFVIKWILSLLIGSFWVTISTIIAEKVDGKLGGLIVGLPSTAVVSLLFIGLTQGVEAATTASMVMPLSSGLYCFFFLAYLIQTKKGFAVGFVSSMIVWFIFAFIASKLPVSDLLTSTVIWLVLITTSIWWAVKNINIDETKIPKKIQSSPLWIKASLTGIVISTIVLISKLAGPTWGGIFATFPALTISTFLITIKSGGVEFTRLIAKNVLISTTTTIGLLAIFAYFFFPIFGVIFGTVLAYVALLLVSIPLYQFIFEKLKQ